MMILLHFVSQITLCQITVLYWSDLIHDDFILLVRWYLLVDIDSSKYLHFKIISSSSLGAALPDAIDEAVELYNTILSELLDKHAPLKLGQ